MGFEFRGEGRLLVLCLFPAGITVGILVRIFFEFEISGTGENNTAMRVWLRLATEAFWKVRDTMRPGTTVDGGLKRLLSYYWACVVDELRIEWGIWADVLRYHYTTNAFHSTGWNLDGGYNLNARILHTTKNPWLSLNCVRNTLPPAWGLRLNLWSLKSRILYHDWNHLEYQLWRGKCSNLRYVIWWRNFDKVSSNYSQRFEASKQLAHFPGRPSTCFGGACSRA